MEVSIAASDTHRVVVSMRTCLSGVRVLKNSQRMGLKHLFILVQKCVEIFITHIFMKLWQTSYIHEFQNALCLKTDLSLILVFHEHPLIGTS